MKSRIFILAIISIFIVFGFTQYYKFKIFKKNNEHLSEFTWKLHNSYESYFYTYYKMPIDGAELLSYLKRNYLNMSYVPEIVKKNNIYYEVNDKTERITFYTFFGLRKNKKSMKYTINETNFIDWLVGRKIFLFEQNKIDLCDMSLNEARFFKNNKQIMNKKLLYNISKKINDSFVSDDVLISPYYYDNYESIFIHGINKKELKLSIECNESNLADTITDKLIKIVKNIENINSVDEFYIPVLIKP